MKATDIIWETDGVDVDLPTEVEIPTEIEDDDDAITDYLSDTYGFLVIDYALPMDDDDIDEFGIYVNEVEGRVS